MHTHIHTLSYTKLPERIVSALKLLTKEDFTRKKMRPHWHPEMSEFSAPLEPVIPPFSLPLPMVHPFCQPHSWHLWNSLSMPMKTLLSRGSSLAKQHTQHLNRCGDLAIISASLQHIASNHSYVVPTLLHPSSTKKYE